MTFLPYADNSLGAPYYQVPLDGSQRRFIEAQSWMRVNVAALTSQSPGGLIKCFLRGAGFVLLHSWRVGWNALHGEEMATPQRHPSDDFPKALRPEKELRYETNW